ncbi:hypothetical protein ACSBOB_20650 [Mesorhizobium sp. ASY16-5R]|uniref:hypothetical protein n=1 Tax=Mesorhizobium sp. ASY16-5R TaxID=3445772 RepID=UPI003FA1649C
MDDVAAESVTCGQSGERFALGRKVFFITLAGGKSNLRARQKHVTSKRSSAALPATRNPPKPVSTRLASRRREAHQALLNLAAG